MSRALSIAFLSHLASPVAPTGAERSLALLAQGLARRGHRVVVVVPGAWALREELLAAGIDVETIPCTLCWLTYHDPLPWPVVALKWLRWWVGSRGEPTRLVRYLRSFGPDVVHVNCLPHLRGAAAGRAAGAPVVWHLREILPSGRRRRWLAGHLRRRAEVIVAVSEAVGQWVREEGLGSRLEVVPNGVEWVAEAGREDPRLRRDLGIPEDGVLVGLFGQLIPHKGALAFVEAARRALAVEPGLRFVLAGAGPQRFRGTVAEAIEATGRPDRFHMLPPQRSGEKLIGAADVVCLTTSTPDPLPRVILEAMAAGKPVAAFRSGGTPELVLPEETGLLVPTGDMAALGQSFVRLARDGTLRATLGEAAARRARERFSLELHLERMEAVFRRAAG